MRRIFYILLAGMITMSCGDESDIGSPLSNDGVGIGGSTARFTINGDFLYIVNDAELKAIDISTTADPIPRSTTDLGWGIETIFGYKDNLFIGSQTGMFIYSVQEDGSPVYQSEYMHQTACDPVIANDQYAYVTIRSGEACNNQLFEANQLITIDISNLNSPFEVDTEQMINPRGLAFFKGDLYVAEGNNGLKQFSLEDPSNPELIHFHQDIPANDMIALEETMIITRDNGIFQFGCVDDDLQLFAPLR